MKIKSSVQPRQENLTSDLFLFVLHSETVWGIKCFLKVSAHLLPLSHSNKRTRSNTFADQKL